MKKTSRLRRAVLAALLSTHAFGASVALADGLLERPRSDAVHLEAQGGDCSSPVHVHAQCALCLVLAQRDVHVPTRPTIAPPVDVIEFRLSAAGDPPANAPVAAPRGRSPPKV